MTSGPTDTGGETAATGGALNVATLTATLTANIAPFQAAIRTTEQLMGGMERAVQSGNRTLQQAADVSAAAFGKTSTAITQMADQVTSSQKQMTGGLSQLTTEVDRLLDRASQLAAQGLIPADLVEGLTAKRQQVQGITGDLMALKGGLEELIRLGEEGGLALPTFLQQAREELDRLNFDIKADQLRRFAEKANMAASEVQAIIDSAKQLGEEGGYAAANKQLVEATNLIQELTRARNQHIGVALREAQARAAVGDAAMSEMAALEALRKVTASWGDSAEAESLRSATMDFMERSQRFPHISYDVDKLRKTYPGFGTSLEAGQQRLARLNKMFDEIEAQGRATTAAAYTNWRGWDVTGDVGQATSRGVWSESRGPLNEGDLAVSARREWFGPMSQSLGQEYTRYPGGVAQLRQLSGQTPWDYTRLAAESLDFSSGVETATRAQQAAEQATTSWMGAAAQATSTLTQLSGATWEFGGAVQQLDTAISQSSAAELIQQQWAGLEQRLNRLKAMVPSLYSEISGMADKAVRSWDTANRPITKGSGLGRIGDIASGSDAESVGAEVAQLEAAVSRAESLAPMLVNLQQQVMQLNELRFDGLINEFHRLTTQVQGSAVADALTEQYRKLGTEGTQQLRQAIETQRSLIAEMARAIAEDMSPIASTITEAQATVGQFRLDQVLAQLGDLGDRAGLTISQVDALREGLNRMAETVGLDVAVQKANELTTALQAQAQALAAPPPDAVLEVMTRMRDVTEETAGLTLDRLIEQFYTLADAAQMSEADTEAVLDAIQRIAAVNPQAAVQSLSQASQAVAGLAREVEAAKQPSADLQTVTTVLQGTMAKTAELSYEPLLRQFEQLAEKAGYTTAEVDRVRAAIQGIANTQGVETANAALRQLTDATGQLIQTQDVAEGGVGSYTNRLQALYQAYRALVQPVNNVGSAMGSAQTAMSAFGTALAGVAGPAAIAVAAFIAVSKAGQLITRWAAEGAQLQSAARAFDRAFGTMTDTARAFAHSFAEVAGLTETQTEAMFADLQRFLTGYQLSTATAAEIGSNIMRIAGDIAAARGNIAELPGVLHAVQYAALGSSQTLRRYGIAIRQTEVSQRAMEMTGKDLVQTLTEQERILAFIEILQERSQNTTGALSDEQETLAVRIQRVQAQFVNLTDAIKEAFIPVLEAVIPVAENVLESLGPVLREVRWLAQFVGWASEQFTGNTVDDAIIAQVERLNAAGEEVPEWLTEAAQAVPGYENAMAGLAQTQRDLAAAAEEERTALGERTAAMEQAQFAALGLAQFMESGWDTTPAVEALRRIGDETKTVIEWLDDLVDAQLAATNQEYALLQALDTEGNIVAQMEQLRKQGKEIPAELTQQWGQANLRTLGLLQELGGGTDFANIFSQLETSVWADLIPVEAMDSLKDKADILSKTTIPALTKELQAMSHAVLPDAQELEQFQADVRTLYTDLRESVKKWEDYEPGQQQALRQAISTGVIPEAVNPYSDAYMGRFADQIEGGLTGAAATGAAERMGWTAIVDQAVAEIRSAYGIEGDASTVVRDAVGDPLVEGIVSFTPFARPYAARINDNVETALSAVRSTWGIAATYSQAASIQVGQPLGAGVAEVGEFAAKLAHNIIGQVNDAMLAVMDFFGISSPSETWAYYVGEPIGQGIAEGISRAETDIVTAAQGVISAALAAASAPLQYQQAQIGLRQAERRLADLQERRDEIQPDVDIGFGMGITAQEQVAIEDAQRQLWLAQKAHDAGIITDAQLMVAEENLEDVQRQASETSDELARLNDDIASAELAVAQAQLGIVSSFMAMVQAGSEFTPEMEAVFRDIAEMAGLPQDTIDELIGHMQTAAQAAVDFGNNVDTAMVQAAAAAANGAASIGGSLGGIRNDMNDTASAASALAAAVATAFASIQPTNVTLPEVQTVVGGVAPAATSAGSGGIGHAIDMLNEGTEVIRSSSSPPPPYQPFTPMQQPEVPAWAYRAPEMPKTVAAVLPAEFTDEVRSAINGGFSEVEVNVPKIETPKVPEVKVPEIPTAKMAADLSTAIGRGFGSVKLPEVTVDNHNEFLIPEPGSFWPDVTVDVTPLQQLVSAGFTGVTGAIERATTPQVTVNVPPTTTTTTQPVTLYSTVEIDGKEVAKAVKRWEFQVNGR